MAGGIGVGIGSFLNSLAGGYGVARQWDKEDADARLTERKLKLLEDRDARDAANYAEDRTWKRQDRATVEAERLANKPLEDAKRAYGIQGFIDAQKEHDMKAAAGEAATTAFKANPQKYNSVAEAYRDVAVPMVVEGYLKRGDTTSADAFSKWANDERIKNGIETVGKLEQSFRRGDWDSVNKHYNALMSDGAYVPDTGFKYSAEPIKSKDGKTVGLRATTTSPDGESTNEDYTDIAQVHQKLMPMISPSTMFEFAKHQYDQEQTAKADRAKGLNKLANDITLEGVKSAGRIAEERAKALGPQSVKDYTNGVLKTMQYQSENNPGFARLPADEQASQAAQIYEQVRARSGQGGGQQQVPTTRNLGGPQYQVQPPAPTPTPKSIMPAFSRQNPYSLR